MTNTVRYLLVVASIFATSLLGSYFTNIGLESWYSSLNLPEITPQGGLIGAVWTTIYVLLAISAILFYKKASEGPQRRWVSILLGINLLLNATWSYVFFTANLIGLAVLWAAILGISVLILMFAMYKVSRVSSWLLVPYAGWVFFATYLNYLIWSLN